MISCDARITNRSKFCPANSLLSLVVECSFIADECNELIDMINKISTPQYLLHNEYVVI